MQIKMLSHVQIHYCFDCLNLFSRNEMAEMLSAAVNQEDNTIVYKEFVPLILLAEETFLFCLSLYLIKVGLCGHSVDNSWHSDQSRELIRTVQRQLLHNQL